MNKITISILIGLGIAAGVLLFLLQNENVPPKFPDEIKTIQNFRECQQAGYAIMESYPRQCKGPAGRTFVEDIGNELEKQDLIRIETPRPNAEISSPILVEGEARGFWFFEASFPVRIYDSNNVELGVVPAQAQGEWMTEDFVPFSATLEFDEPTTETGTLVLEKDNPSGLKENDDSLRVPVVFKAAKRTSGGCVITGCSSHVCAETEVVTTCEYNPEYACYQNATCERQENGECGWTMDDELEQCLAQMG